MTGFDISTSQASPLLAPTMPLPAVVNQCRWWEPDVPDGPSRDIIHIMNSSRSERIETSWLK